jgi:amino acid transporter
MSSSSNKENNSFKHPYIIALLELVLCPILILIGVERDDFVLDYCLIGLVLVITLPAVIFLGIYLLRTSNTDKEPKQEKEGEIK